MKAMLMIISALAVSSVIVGCDKSEAHDAENLYGGSHYLVAHNTGSKQEDTNGCPCTCLALGWSSYSTMTNAFAHGIQSPFDELKKRRGCTNGVVRLVDVCEVEKEIEKELNESKEGTK